MSAIIRRISWVIILLTIWKVLMNRLSPNVSYFNFAGAMKNMLRNMPGGYIAAAKRYRTFAARESDPNKKTEYLKRAEEMEHKDKQQKELTRERDANKTVNDANNAQEEPSLDWRGRTTSPQQQAQAAVRKAMKAFRSVRKF